MHQIKLDLLNINKDQTKAYLSEISDQKRKPLILFVSK